MDHAPFFADVADGPENGAAWWLRAHDGVRLRAGAWRGTSQEGTVLLFPGRTEYIEKYGRTAREFAQRGFATLTIDWRGQGLSDRLSANVMSGHVGRFTDYQQDVAALLSAAEALDMPKPWHLLAHSMGGCIGLRAVLDGLPVQSCVFSGPMWGIQMARSLRPLAWSLSFGVRYVGLGHLYAPGTDPANYVLTEPFETNKLTGCQDMYKYMIDQALSYPELGLGGPSLQWLYEALKETRALASRPSPDLPCMTVLGTKEEIVCPRRIEHRMTNWPGARLELVQQGRHEVLMDSPEMRGPVFDTMCEMFSSAAATDRTGTFRDRA